MIGLKQILIIIPFETLTHARAHQLAWDPSTNASNNQGNQFLGILHEIDDVSSFTSSMDDLETDVIHIKKVVEEQQNAKICSLTSEIIALRAEIKKIENNGTATVQRNAHINKIKF